VGERDDLLAVSRWSSLGEQKDWREAMTILNKQAEILSFPESLHPLASGCDFDNSPRLSAATRIPRFKRNPPKLSKAATSV